MKRIVKAAAVIQLAVGASVAACGSGWAAGAVVESPDKHTAYWVTHKASQDIAAQIALGNCGSRYGHCWLKTTFEHGCLAVAVAHSLSGGIHWSWVIRHSPEEAQDAAMARCAGDGYSCTLKASSCE